MASNSGILIPPPALPATVAATNDIRPIKPPVAVPNPWAWVWWMGGVIVVAALVALAISLLRKKQQARAYVPPVPPHVRARQKLEAALLLINDPRAFAIAVSDAVRVYLEERFELRAPERTTEEFLRDLQQTSVLTEPQKTSLSEFLEQCDLVKFARFEPPESLLRELRESALGLVHETQYDAAPLPDSTADEPSGDALAKEERQRDAGGTSPSA